MPWENLSLTTMPGVYILLFGRGPEEKLGIFDQKGMTHLQKKLADTKVERSSVVQPEDSVQQQSSVIMHR